MLILVWPVIIKENVQATMFGGLKMENNYIQLNKDNILRLGIKDSEGNDTGNVLEFDLEDASLLLRYQELVEKEKKNRIWLNNQFLIIDKKQDHKGKKLLSSNEQAKLESINEFFKREKEVLDIFLGEGGTDKLLNGRKMGWTSLQEINDIVVNQISPYIDKSMENLTNKVKELYKDSTENDVI